MAVLRAASVALLIFVALVVGGCGGGDEETTTSASQAETTIQQAGGEGQSFTKPKAEIVDTTTLPEPKEGSKEPAPGVPTSKGGDNSIQTWGLEASAGEREQVTADLQAFFDARVNGEWARACSYLVARSRSTFEGVGGGRGNAACGRGMGALNRGVSSRVFEQEAKIEDVLSLRVDERFAFLIYTRGDGMLYAIGFEHEDDAWKIVSVSPNELGRVASG